MKDRWCNTQVFKTVFSSSESFSNQEDRMTQNLTRASRELFRRTPDETFPSLEALVSHCHKQREDSTDHWMSPATLWTKPVNTDQLLLAGSDDTTFALNDWSFGQLCRLSGVTKETVNRLPAETAARVFAETLPRGNKPLQVFTDR